MTSNNFIVTEKEYKCFLQLMFLILVVKYFLRYAFPRDKSTDTFLKDNSMCLKYILRNLKDVCHFL